jgi:hypothetical protein
MKPKTVGRVKLTDAEGRETYVPVEVVEPEVKAPVNLHVEVVEPEVKAAPRPVQVVRRSDEGRP